MEIAKGTIFFPFSWSGQTYPTENEPRVKLMKANRPFGASLLKKLGKERKKGRRGWRKKDERKHFSALLSLLTCFTLMPTLFLNKFARKRVLRRLGQDFDD